MNATTGDIITRRMIGNPMQSHYGVFVMYGTEPHVIHNQQGGQTFEPLDQFLEGRPIREVIPSPVSGMDAEEIINKYLNMPGKDFNLFTYNCEQFAHRLTSRKVYNREFAAALVTALVILIIWLHYN